MVNDPLQPRGGLPTTRKRKFEMCSASTSERRWYADLGSAAAPRALLRACSCPPSNPAVPAARRSDGITRAPGAVVRHGAGVAPTGARLRAQRVARDRHNRLLIPGVVVFSSNVSVRLVRVECKQEARHQCRASLSCLSRAGQSTTRGAGARAALTQNHFRLARFRVQRSARCKRALPAGDSRSYLSAIRPERYTRLRYPEQLS